VIALIGTYSPVGDGYVAYAKQACHIFGGRHYLMSDIGLMHRAAVLGRREDVLLVWLSKVIVLTQLTAF
jgi:hypothetical protein